MIHNRSVPSNTLIAHIRYPDVEQAVEWLTKAFGFRENFRYGSPASGAQMRVLDAWIMVKRAGKGELSPAQLGYGTQSVTVFLEDVEGHCACAKAAGAKIVEEPHETEYGEFQYAAIDFAGHHWLFSRHARDVNPSDWGATLARE
ncbi:MAG: VOC family protein [Candidatus Acidiferrales bacterium]